MKSTIKKLIKKIMPQYIVEKRRARLLDKQRADFHKSCKELLELVDDILRKENIPYWLNYGTLLGAYRDHNFIPHDYDMDVALFWEDREKIKDLMFKASLKLKYEVHFGGWDNPENLGYRFEYKHAFVDFDFYKLKDSIAYTYNPDFIEGSVLKPNVINPVIAEEVRQRLTGLMDFDFLGRKYLVPENTEEYLIANYGENYRTPVKDFHYHDVAQNLKVYTFEEKPSYMMIFD